MGNQNRIYGEKIDLDGSKINDFFNKRAIDFRLNKLTRDTSVMFSDNNPNYAKKCNHYEKDFILPLLKIDKTEAVLDIGCGTGRWAESLIPLCSQYIGTDISQEMIKVASNIYCSKYDNAKFINVSFQNLFEKAEINEIQFNKIIITGVSMYLNDGELQECYKKLCKILAPDGLLYLKESIGLKSRLTLNNIWSDNLKSNYWATYRTVDEYHSLLKPLMDCSEIIKSGYFNIFDKKDMPETSHWYIILKRVL